MARNTFFRVHSDASQSERRAILRNERAAGTYHQFAAAEADAIGGRFAARERSAVTTTPQYPDLPESSWVNQAAAVPPEEPLGVDINAVEPTGTPAEIERIGDVHSDGVGELLPDTVDGTLPGDARFAAGNVQPSASKSRRRRTQNAKSRRDASE
jgi:hypothetical protein